MAKIFSPLLLLFLGQYVFAQTEGVSINNSGATPHSSAIIDISSTSKGTLITRMNSAQRDAIVNPAQSLMIFNTSSNCFEFFSGSNWAILGCGCIAPDAAGGVTGPSDVCQGQQNVVYSVNSIVNAIGYVWSLPPGATIIAGTNTNTITVEYSVNAASGNISVYGYSASCGNGAASANFPVTVDPLPTSAGSITGSSMVCQGQNNVAYSIPPVNFATSYTWSYTGTGVIFSGNSNSITIDFSNSATSGILTVSGTNECGNGVSSAAYAVNVNPLPSAAGLISGSQVPCENSSGNTYSISPVANAASYSWTIPSGASISVNNGNAITVTYGTISGQVSVTPLNSCGSGPGSSVSVNLNTIPVSPGSITG
ncbi:MAG: hypothetical protein IT223_12810, partial [Crocinitomicaceae bacterium]|nr:hypothetical protein [Crocinitomicaceae bacterium]